MIARRRWTVAPLQSRSNGTAERAIDSSSANDYNTRVAGDEI